MDKESLRKLVPVHLRKKFVEPLLRRVGAALVDFGTFLLGGHEEAIPPTRLHFVGHGSFTATGFEFLRYLTEFALLQPTDVVLDVGCGIGRMAIPLTNFLRKGRYTGIDIVPAGIKWCQQNITSKHPNFTFEVSDIYNKMYNPQGTFRASEYRFPFDASSFDVVFLTSVFTHLLPQDVEHYLSEISRVLRPGGRLLGTWFLLNDESRSLIAEGKSSRAIVHELQGKEAMVADQDVPEDAIAFDEGWVRSLHERLEMDVQMPIRFGKWCGRPEFVTYQDIVVATKR